jgi:Ca-activated chloride channel family protein
MLTAEQWMNTVDTSTGDFLRQRFAIEAAQGAATDAPATDVPADGAVADDSG